MLCKSHLLVKSVCSIDASQHPYFTFYPWGGLVTIHWSETIQFHEWVVLRTLPFIPQSPLCPVTAVKGALHFICQALPYSQAFTFLRSPDFILMHFSYPFFLKKVKCHSLCPRALGQILRLLLLLKGRGLLSLPVRGSYLS